MPDLVIVESPTKARTLSKFLGKKYHIEASLGHIRDLPKGELGVDVNGDFEPKYIVPRAKTKIVNALKKLNKSSGTLYLATDPDREGEAIAWHLSILLQGDSRKNKNEIKRVVFHEITPEAVDEAFKNPRNLDLKLVDAQQARRVLDRLVGYKLSPLLWQKVKEGLSAGRVQSVAVKLIVDRENEIRAFKPVEFWSIEVELAKEAPKSPNLVVTLTEENGKKTDIKNKDQADKLTRSLEKASYRVAKISQKEVKRYPVPPFITSTLQQAASIKLGITARKTMMVAQNLYEHGLITYMRTDSVNLSDAVIRDTRSYIVQNFGENYLPLKPKVYKTKSKVAQEAHEAIRPTNMKFKAEALRGQDWVARDHLRIYELIWKRTLACQMNEAVLDQTTVNVAAEENNNRYLLRATGNVVKFDGWLKVYKDQSQKLAVEEEDDEDKREQRLPELTEGEKLDLEKVIPSQHFTEPLPRYTDASIIKKLEDLGIGRPSTYAPTLSTIQDRFYVEKQERKFYPTELGEVVTKFLMEYFPEIIDYSFTAQMEEDLDSIARGERKWKEAIAEFYHPFIKKILEIAETAEKMKPEVRLADQKCPECGKELLYRFGKFGKFLACSGFPGCRYTATLHQKLGINCPQCQGEIVIRKTKKGRPFYGCKNWPGCKFASWTKPKQEDKK